jgi:hypothetical protein
MKINFLLRHSFWGRGCSSSQSKKIGSRIVLSCLFSCISIFFLTFDITVTTVTLLLKKIKKKQYRQALQRCNTTFRTTSQRYKLLRYCYTCVTHLLQTCVTPQSTNHQLFTFLCNAEIAKIPSRKKNPENKINYYGNPHFTAGNQF